jgi:hypothetical protein
MPSLRMTGAIPPLAFTSSWYGALLSPGATSLFPNISKKDALKIILKYTQSTISFLWFYGPLV